MLAFCFEDAISCCVFSFNNKKSLYLSLILRLQFFEKQSCKAGALLVIKPFSIPQTLRRVSVSPKKKKKKKKTARFFQTRFYFWFTFLDNTSHKSETNLTPHPPPKKKKVLILFASIWDRFLSQASALLPFQYAATLSRGKGSDLFLQNGPFQTFETLFEFCLPH